VAREISEEGQDMLAEPAIDAVKVLTLHAAKGLEWPVVVLVDLAQRSETVFGRYQLNRNPPSM